MLKPIETFNKGALVASAAIAGAMAPLLSDAVKPKYGSGVAGMVTFVVILIFLALVQFLVESLTRSSPALRRLLLGHSFVEGFWVDVSYDSSKCIAGAACLYIYYDDDQLEISGTSHTKADGLFSSWDVNFANWENHTLSYAFESHNNRADSAIERGYGELMFSHGSHIPTSYTGFFFDTTNRKVISVEGRRISDKAAVRRLENPDERRRFLVERVSSPDGGSIATK
jgi:hypothetical protein